jgi:hypothetical protein
MLGNRRRDFITLLGGAVALLFNPNTAPYFNFFLP